MLSDAGDQCRQRNPCVPRGTGRPACSTVLRTMRARCVHECVAEHARCGSAMLFRQSRLASIVLLIPIVGMALLALADLGIGNVAAVLAPGTAYAPTFWGTVLLVESAMLFATVCALPAPYLRISRDAVRYARPLRPEATIRWEDIRRWHAAAGRDKRDMRLRLIVPRRAVGWSPLDLLASVGTGTATLTFDTWTWRLIAPAPPSGSRIQLGEVLVDCLTRPELRPRLPDAASARPFPAVGPVAGKRAAIAAVALAFAWQISTLFALDTARYSPQSLAAQYGRAAALLLVLVGLACWLLGTDGGEPPRQHEGAAHRARWRMVAIACFLLGALTRLVCTLVWNRAGVLAMYFDLRGTWLLLGVMLPLVPALLTGRGRAWLVRVLAVRRDTERLLWFGLALFLVVGPIYQDYLSQLYGNRMWAVMSIRDAVFLPYVPLCVIALCVFSAGAPPAVQRILLCLQCLAGLVMITIAELFAVGFAQVMADLNAWMSSPPTMIDAYTTRQLALTFAGGLLIEAFALGELVSRSSMRVLSRVWSDARELTRWVHAELATLRAWGGASFDAHTLALLFVNRWRIYSVLGALFVTVSLISHLAQPPSVAACCRPGAQAALPPAQAAAGAVWVRPIDGMRMRFVPGGSFLMGLPESAVPARQALCRQEYGSDSAACDSSIDALSQPQHAVSLGGYWIDETDVTNAQFAHFVAATGYETDAERQGWGWVWVRPGGDTRLPGADWRHPLGPGSTISGLDRYPVVQVSWRDAEAYASWAGMTLPTEAQWELAAHGPTFAPYPWGSAPLDGTRANYCDAACPRYSAGDGRDGYAYTSPVGQYPAGASPYGVLDMAGNVLQWTSSRYAPYPGATYHDPLYGSGDYVERGGSYATFPAAAYTTNRDAASPDTRMEYVGFRCATPVTTST